MDCPAWALIPSIAKVNSGRSIPKAEVTSANSQTEVTLEIYTSLAYFMLQRGSKNFLLFQIFILYKWKFRDKDVYAKTFLKL
jgi:hypothetical protein